MADFTLKVGDLAPSLFFQLKEPDPEAPGQLRPIDLTGRSVRVRMRTKGSTGALTVDRDATVTDALTGRGRFDWQSPETSALGLYVAEFRVNGPQQTVPNDTHLLVAIIAPV